MAEPDTRFNIIYIMRNTMLRNEGQCPCQAYVKARFRLRNDAPLTYQWLEPVSYVSVSGFTPLSPGLPDEYLAENALLACASCPSVNALFSGHPRS